MLHFSLGFLEDSHVALNPLRLLMVRFKQSAYFAARPELFFTQLRRYFQTGFLEFKPDFGLTNSTFAWFSATISGLISNLGV